MNASSPMENSTKIRINSAVRRTVVVRQRRRKLFTDHVTRATDGLQQWRRVALVDPEAVGLNVTVFVAIKTSDHSEDWLESFATAARALPEVVELYRMAGDVDYFVKLLVRDVGDYDRVYRKLIATAPMSDVSASFAMERIKFDTAVPL